ncbi:hypothetical protein F5Y05DRAFT_418495 [Hypoxylon sp. FL0543]|nr:hypothetical protein F5Y05DRAFT_418495 [Hypoxylon sp. FL0543]
MTTAAAPPAETAGVLRPCNRCKEQEGTIDLRGAETVCRACFAYYVSSKAVKRLEALQRDPATPRSKGAGGQRRPQRYLVGLSCGPSSTALLHVLTENVRLQRARGQKTARFEYVAVHVVDDTLRPFSSAPSHSPPSSSPSSPSIAGSSEADGSALAAYRTRFPEAELLSVPLSSALALPSIDWTALPSPPPASAGLSPAQQLAHVLSALPSATSRADVRRLLVRHLLVATAARRNCDALLLGHSTTSLAELTLSETAKGRGFSLPWLVNDGAAPLPASITTTLDDPQTQTQTQTQTQSPDKDQNDRNTTNGTSKKDPKTRTTTTTSLPIYSPLRELFRKELVAYLSHASPPLLDILPAPEAAAGAKKGGGNSGAVVSHRELSIDDVLSRYFGEVEASYPSVVANVVRTTGKLLRRPDASNHNHDHDHDHGDNGNNAAGGNSVEGEEGKTCGLCGAALDAPGDERWRGEIGDRDDGASSSKPGLCYGCERSVRG